MNFLHWPGFIEVHCSVKAAQWGLLVTVTLQSGAASCSESPAWPEGAQAVPSQHHPWQGAASPGEEGFTTALPSQALLP